MPHLCLFWCSFFFFFPLPLFIYLFFSLKSLLSLTPKMQHSHFPSQTAHFISCVWTLPWNTASLRGRLNTLEMGQRRSACLHECKYPPFVLVVQSKMRAPVICRIEWNISEHRAREKKQKNTCLGRPWLGWMETKMIHLYIMTNYSVANHSRPDLLFAAVPSWQKVWKLLVFY